MSRIWSTAQHVDRSLSGVVGARDGQRGEGQPRPHGDDRCVGLGAEVLDERGDEADRAEQVGVDRLHRGGEEAGRVSGIDLEGPDARVIGGDLLEQPDAPSADNDGVALLL